MPSKQQRRKEAKRQEARREFRKGLVVLVVLAVVGFTLPTTLPIAQEHVLMPLSEFLASTLQDSFEQPAAPPP